MQCLRVFDYEIGTLPQRHDLSEGTLYLSRDLKMVEDRFLALVELHYFLLIRRNE